MWSLLNTQALRRPSLDTVLFILRVAVGAALCFGHGIGKYQVLKNNPEVFPDPLGLGPHISIVTSMAAECGASFLVALGVCTRLACLPIVFTMLTVALVVHHDHTWLQTEPSVLFFLFYTLIFYLGPGAYSVDGVLLRRRARAALKG